MIQWSKTCMLVIIAMVLTSIPSLIYAQDTQDPEMIVENDIITFTDFGIDDVTFISDDESTTLRFAFPADWDFQEGISFQLDTNSLLFGPDYSGDYVENATGILNIEFNDYVLDSIIFNWGVEGLLDIFVPAEMLISQRSDQRHDLHLTIRSGVKCGKLLVSGIFIKPNSTVTIPHHYRSPSTDLRALPYPIYQQSFLEDSAVIVVPNNPSTSALEAAMNVSTGFGYATDEKLSLSLVPEWQLTNDLKDNNHLIFVGELDLFNSFAEFDLPIEEEATGNQVDEEDGIIQMIVSPYNNNKVVLVVTGLESAGVGLAGQVISAFNIRTSQPHNVAIIKDINPTTLNEVDTNIVNATLEQVGFDNILIDRVGTNSAEIEFQVDNLNTIGYGAYIDVALSHSTLINYDNSGINVLVNKIPIGSIKLSNDTSDKHIKRISIPINVFVSGINTLSFQVMLNADDECFFRDEGTIWANILAETKLFIPQASDLRLIENAPIDLNVYPNPYVFPPTLSDTTIVVPPNDPSAWNVAMKIAANLGRSSDGDTTFLAVQYSDDVNDITKSEHLIIIGTATELSILSELAEYLPAQFEEESNFINEDILPIEYEMPEWRDIGYVMQFPSPFAEDRVVLLVTGSTDQGVEWSGNALTESVLRRSLFGDFAIIDDIEIMAQRLQPIPKRVSTENPELSEDTVETDPTIEVLLDESKEIANRPDWIIPAMRLVLVLMGGVILFVALTSILRLLYARFKKTEE
jgi:cellulose synthase operon protein B